MLSRRSYGRSCSRASSRSVLGLAGPRESDAEPTEIQGVGEQPRRSRAVGECIAFYTFAVPESAMTRLTFVLPFSMRESLYHSLAPILPEASSCHVIYHEHYTGTSDSD